MKVTAVVVLVLALSASACGFAPPAEGNPARQRLISGTISEVVDRATVRVVFDGSKVPADGLTLRSFAGTKYRGMGPLTAASFAEAGFGVGAPVSAEIAVDPQDDGTYICYAITFTGR